jgi:hypothetical protein
MSDNRVVDACEKLWTANQHDCSGFLRAVAAELGIVVTGLANDIVGQMQETPWQPLQSGSEAAEKAQTAFVVGGLTANPHGHVVVVVPGPLDRGKYPTAYWGKLGGVGKKATTINWSWDADDRDKVIYAWRSY